VIGVWLKNMGLRFFLTALCAVSLASGAELRQVTEFGENPTKIQMYEYVPEKVADSPPVIVNVRIP
jgi:hypothetical protein